MIAEYAVASAAAAASTARSPSSALLVKLDTRGFAELSMAWDKLLEQAKNIEALAAERLSKQQHADDIVEAGLGVMLFDAVRLSAAEETDGRKRVVRRRRATAQRSDPDECSGTCGVGSSPDARATP